MLFKLGYDSYVKRLNSATVAALIVAAAVVVLAVTGAQTAVAQIMIAQINGTPASVTSPNFGGHLNSTPGVPASVTSLGPNGFQPKSQFFTQPLLPVNPNPLFPRRNHHRQNSFFPAGGAIYVPYPVPVEPEADDSAAPANPADDDRGGPTIFDRRGSGQPARSFLDDYPPRPRSRSENRDQPERESAAPTSPFAFRSAGFRNGARLRTRWTASPRSCTVHIKERHKRVMCAFACEATYPLADACK